MDFFQQHTGGILILILTALLVLALLVLIPQLLRSHQRSLELQHTERMKALEAGQILPQENVLRHAAGRTAVLVPAIAVIAAAAVTGSLAVYQTNSLLALTLTIWCVTGVVSLAAITAGVALMGRLAQLDEAYEDAAERAHRENGKGPRGA